LESADTYFHRGVGHKAEMALDNSIFQRVAAQVSPDVHVHVKGTDIREIMPWLWLAIRTNPSNVEPYLIASYWLTREARKPDLAREVLQEAFRRNPRSYRVLLELATLYMHFGQREEAKRTLTAALATWPGKEDPEDKDVKKAKQEMLLYRSLLFEMDGDVEHARQDLEEVVHIFPAQSNLAKRIRQLREGGRSAQEVTNAWNTLLIAPHEDKRFPDHENCARTR
jgi:tetratricopeptide (TPR) repeat protein